MLKDKKWQWRKSVETLRKNLVSEAIACNGNRDENFGRKIKYVERP